MRRIKTAEPPGLGRGSIGRQRLEWWQSFWLGPCWQLGEGKDEFLAVWYQGTADDPPLHNDCFCTSCSEQDQCEWVTINQPSHTHPHKQETQMGKCKGQHLDVQRTQRKKGLNCIRKKSPVPLSSASADPEPPGGTSLELSPARFPDCTLRSSRPVCSGLTTPHYGTPYALPLPCPRHNEASRPLLVFNHSKQLREEERGTTACREVLMVQNGREE